MAAAVILNGTGDEFFESEDLGYTEELDPLEIDDGEGEADDPDLPQCKIKRNYACPRCSYFTQNPRFYLYHLKNVHKEKLRIYECPSCLYASRHSQKLHRHMQMVHDVVTGKKRDKAQKQPVERMEPEEEEEFKDENGEEFLDGSENADEEEKGFKCGLCPFTSKNQNLVSRHERVVHLKKKFFKCMKCNYVTHMKARFTKHVKYHSMPMIKCEMCDFKTPYKWNLDRHMKNHMSDGAFRCRLCNFTADIKQSLTVHEMNHHVPPVGHVSQPNKRKNRVGASDTHPPDPDPDQQMQAFNELSMLNEIEITKRPENPQFTRKAMMKKPKPISHFSAKELTVKFGEKVVDPNDVIQHKNGTVYVKKLKCRVCNYRAAWESEMSRHEQRVHGLEDKKSMQKAPRPIPNLIPIQNKPAVGPPPTLAIPPPPPPLTVLPQQHRPILHQKPIHQLPPHPQFHPNMNRHPFIPPPQPHFPQTHSLPPQYPHPSRFAQPKNMSQNIKKNFQPNTPPKQLPPKPSPTPPPILKIPTPTKVRNASTPGNSSPDKAMTEKDLNDICAKSCPNSSLKDFASLMGGDEAFKPDNDSVLHKESNDMNEQNKKSQDSTVDVLNNDEEPKSPEALKKKNSFFDELKEKFGAGESCNLICNVCGHESKCLSESLRHQKIHNIQVPGNSGNNAVFSGADLSSTRCQYCRQRCKTSADLLVHLKSCSEAKKATTETINIEDDDEEEEEYKEEGGGERMDFEDGEGEEDYKSEDGYEDQEGQNPPHPMENRVFVWTNMANGEEDGLDDEYDCGSQSPNSDCVFGVETAPGIGAVTSKNKAASHGNITGQIIQPKEPKQKQDNSVKKVYKCPHCSFWASTASRFHVHIVGHLNKKPFECSLCCYRSNWRWDITKHIRLKTVRDSTHQRAKVLMTDETGRRNYSKYNKYLTLMRVHEPKGESSGAGLRGKKITQSFEPIETIPAPPKLTPAPPSALQGDGNTAPPVNQFRTVYPKPPPLQPSNELKRKMPQDSGEEPTKKKGLLENKKTMWKCKKCLFRDSDRAVVLAHVKEHYRNQAMTHTSQADSPDERHCRLKHNGDVNVILAPRQSTDESDHNTEDNDTESFMCETCPYVASSQLGLDDHMEKHFERPDAPHKCYFCPFYVTDREELMEHMSLHGEPEGEGEGEDSLSGREDSVANHYTPSGPESGEMFMNKRYRCTACPYVSNSKTQFLYHKAFHRPRGAPFQCTMCSYNVPRRHILLQHLKLHGIHTPPPKTKNTSYIDPDAAVNIKEIDTSNLAEIPLVWVSKLGSLTKMFKCRYCPHVNIRKSNIQEHEKMHSFRASKTNAEGCSPVPHQQHHCPECNYICNNAGVLSSHTKVHQGLFGQVCGLVDLSRSDEDQIKELNALLGREEEGPPEISPDEINKDYRDASSPHTQSTPEKDNRDADIGKPDDRVLHFCSICPARFLYPKELEIHLRFHNLQLQFQCDSCSYTARQQPHLLAHYKVHTDEYQDRTNALCEVYQISEDHPKPKIAVIVDGSEEVGPAWVVVERQKLPARDPQNEYDLDEAPDEVNKQGGKIIIKQFSCDKCPATFFKSVALQYHLQLHGGSSPHKCRVCDYAVKTYGNLIKHEAVHEDLEPRAKLKSKTKRPPENIPASGTELFRHKTEINQKVAATAPPPPAPLHIDPEFGILMHGSPEFVYPTYLKNGRLKEKRYKCHKCPSAFEKREQYKVHLSLHGSKQRYNCERCDYSVKYYANYIQHLRKHQSNDASKAERKGSTDRSTDDSPNDEGSDLPQDVSVEEFQPQPPKSSRSGKKMQMSMADQQAMMLMQQRVISNSVSAPEVTNRCPFCPYSNQRKEGVGSHVKCHSNTKGGAFACKYCDYVVPLSHFLREHNKLHFTPLRSNRPEAYMKCDRLELWSERIVPNSEEKSPEEKPNKVLIFKDKGVNLKEDRYLPAFPINENEQSDDENKEKIYINLKTGEVDTNSESRENSEKEDDKENEKENLDQISKEKEIENKDKTDHNEQVQSVNNSNDTNDEAPMNTEEKELDNEECLEIKDNTSNIETPMEVCEENDEVEDNHENAAEEEESQYTFVDEVKHEEQSEAENVSSEMKNEDEDNTQKNLDENEDNDELKAVKSEIASNNLNLTSDNLNLTIDNHESQDSIASEGPEIDNSCVVDDQLNTSDQPEIKATSSESDTEDSSSDSSSSSGDSVNSSSSSSQQQ